LYEKVEWTEGKTQLRRKKEKRRESDGSILLRGRWGKKRRRGVWSGNQISNRPVFVRMLSSTSTSRQQAMR